MAQFKISHNEVDQEYAEENLNNFVLFINFTRQSRHGPIFFSSHERQLCHSHAFPFFFLIHLNQYIYNSLIPKHEKVIIYFFVNNYLLLSLTL